MARDSLQFLFFSLILPPSYNPETWAPELTRQEERKPNANKTKKVVRTEELNLHDFTLSNILDALTDVPVRGVAGIHLRNLLFITLIRYIHRDPLRRRDSKSFKVPAAVRGSHNRFMNLAAFLPLHEQNWMENFRQLLWELEFSQSPAAEEKDEEEEGGVVKEDADDDDEDSGDEKDATDQEAEAAVKANKDPEIAALSRKFQRLGAAALSTTADRANALSLLIDYACKTTQFRQVVTDWKTQEKNYLASVATVQTDYMRKKSEIDGKISAEKATIKQKKIDAILALQPPPLPGAPARPVPKVTVVEDEHEEIVKFKQEKVLLLQQAEERKQDLAVKRDEQARKLFFQPLGRDRFLNQFWLFKGDEFGNVLLVESPLHWPELHHPRQVPAGGESTLASKPAWSQESQWFLVTSNDEIARIEENLSNFDSNESSLLLALEESKQKVQNSEHFSGARYAKSGLSLSFFDTIFRTVHREEPAQADQDEDSRAANIKQQLEIQGTTY